MSTSKYEGSLKSLQMEEKQRLEKLYQFLSLLLSFHLPWATLVDCQSFPCTTLKYDSLPESYRVNASLAWLHLFKHSALLHSSVWNIDWGLKGIWSQIQVQTATRTCHVSGTEQDCIANLKSNKWPQFSWEKKKDMCLVREQWKDNVPLCKIYLSENQGHIWGQIHV